MKQPGTPLEEMKILDFTYLLPGPFATMMLSDLGAEIIKVENSTRPDMLRYLPPIIDGVGAVYAQVNRGKKSLALDLTRNDAKEVIRKLVAEYDIVIEQFRPGVMAKLGLGYEDLKIINDKIIYCSLTGYGQKGTYADKAGHDINYMALSGVESFSGRLEGGPSLSGIQIADIAGGSKNLVIGVLAAYIKRLSTGAGDYVDISITDGTFAMTAFTTSRFLAGENQPQPGSDLLNGGSLYDFYMTADKRYLSVGPIEGKFFQNFCNIIGCPELVESGIGNNEAKLKIAGIISTKPLRHWVSQFKSTDACVEPVYTLNEAVVNPPISERDMIVLVSTKNGTPMKQVGNPIKFSSGHFFSDTGGVTAGYDNYDILKSLGMNDSEIKKFI